MIRPLIAKTRATPEFGNILYGQEYIIDIVEMENQKNPGKGFISLCSSNPWEAAKRLNVDVDEIKESVTYECPFLLGNKHYWMIPTAIIVAKDIKQYRYPKFSSSMFDHLFDATYTLNSMRELNSIQKVMLGHGYTHFTLPSDGSIELKEFTIALNNGDKLLMSGWIWYNK